MWAKFAMTVRCTSGKVKWHRLCEPGGQERKNKVEYTNPGISI